MAHQKYNHSRRIQDLQSARIKSLYPGTIVQFKYTGKDIFDKSPMVLVLWNDYSESKIHGINLNYLTEFKNNGVVFSGKSEEYEILEIPQHKFFIGCQYHPEFTSRLTKPHPLFKHLWDASIIPF